MIYFGLILALILLILGYRWQFWRLPKRGLLALMYHRVGVLPKQDEQFPFTIPPQRFKEQLEMLQRKGFTPITTADFNKKNPPKKPVLITFDDGTADAFNTVFPIIKEKNIKIIIFLVTDWVGKKGYLTWEQIKNMHQSGLVEFGSHTVHHARLRNLSDHEAFKELIESKKIIEQILQAPCVSFCYPFGSGGFDKRIRPLVFKAGYQFDFSTRQGINPWPWKTKKTLLRSFPRGGETLTDFYIQITRGKSKF